MNATSELRQRLVEDRCRAAGPTQPLHISMDRCLKTGRLIDQPMVSELVLRTSFTIATARRIVTWEREVVFEVPCS